MLQPAIFQGNVQDDEGNVQAGAQISVISVLTGLPVTLFSDLSDTPLTNPFNAGVNGEFQFFYEGELINITATSGGFSRTWTNEYTNTYGLKDKLLNQSNLYTGANSYSSPQNFQKTINVENLNFINGNGGFVETVAGNNSGKVFQIDGNKGLNFFDLSNDNSGTSTTRATTEAGCELRITKRFGDDLGTAAFVNISTGSFTPIFDQSYGTVVTEGASSSLDARWQIVNDKFVTIEVDINLDDAGSNPVVGDRLRFDGVPASLTERLATVSCGTGQLYAGLGSGNLAFYQITKAGDSEFWMTCTNVFGAVDYSDTLSLVMTYEIA